VSPRNNLTITADYFNIKINDRILLGATFDDPTTGAIVARRETLYLTDPKRKHPVVLTSNSYSETVRVKLPAGFAVDEVPDAVKLDTDFGSYATSYEVKDGELIFSRKLVQRATTIPVEQYNSVRSFFERIRAAEQAPVVLIKK